MKPVILNKNQTGFNEKNIFFKKEVEKIREEMSRLDKDRKVDMYVEEDRRIRREKAYKTLKKAVFMLFLAIMVWWAYIVGSFMAYAFIRGGMDSPWIIFLWGFSLMAIVLFVICMSKVED